jgi:aryl-alcohol dehydrogenase-like predicted oxidoreductase
MSRAMSLSGMYGPADDEESLKVLKKAVDIGCTFWDSAVIYGFGHNEKLLGRSWLQNAPTMYVLPFVKRQ